MKLERNRDNREKNRLDSVGAMITFSNKRDAERVDLESEIDPTRVAFGESF